MIVYAFILLLFVIQIISFIFIKDCVINVVIFKKKYLRMSKKRFIKILFLSFDFMLLLLLAVIRDETVGTDYNTYITIFKSFLDLDYDNITDNYYVSKGEFLFVVLGYLIKLIFNDYIYMVLVAYLIILLLTYRFILKYSNELLLSGFLFFSFSFYNMSLNILRQYIAAAIVLKSIDYIDKSFKKFFLCLLVGMAFHKTAILFIVVYPVLKFVKDIRVSCVCLLLISGVIALLSEQFVHIIGDVANYGTKYTTMGSEAEIDLKIFINALLFLAFFCYSKQFQSKDINANKWIAMSAITLGLNFSAVFFHYINRTFLYFMIPEVVAIPNFIKTFDSKIIRYTLELMVVVIFSIYYLYLVSNTTCYDTVPYTSNMLNLGM